MGINSKKIIIFDLDGTLTPSKSSMDEEMSDLLCGLLTKRKIAVIGGGSWKQFGEQFLRHLQCREELLLNLFLFPTTATRFRRYEGGRWAEVYADELTEDEREKIKTMVLTMVKTMVKELGLAPPQKIYGEQVEDRGTQITLSMLGQNIVQELSEEGVRQKKEWNEKYDTARQNMAAKLRELLPEFEVKTGGYTSIDVTKKGIDKAYGIRQIEKTLNIPIKDMLFVGDALYPGGNDEAAKQAGVECIAVSGPEETKKLMGEWLISLT